MDYISSPFHSPALTPAMSNAPWQTGSGQFLTPTSPSIVHTSSSDRQRDVLDRSPPHLPYSHYAIAYMDPVTGRLQTKVSQSLEHREDELFSGDFRDTFLACVEKRLPGFDSSSAGSRISSPHKRTCRGFLTPRSPPAERFQNHSSRSSIETDMNVDEQSCAMDAEGEVSRVPLAIGDKEKVDAYYAFAFRAFQQINCRQIAKAYIKLIEPRKQVKHPYNGGKGIPGEKRDPEKTKPDWWPVGVAHREPDHLKKPDRIHLLIHIFRNLRKSRGITADKLKEAGLDVVRQVKPTDRLNILNEIYRVRSLEEAYEDGLVDGSTTISVTSKDTTRSDLDDVSDTESKGSGAAHGTVRVKRSARKPLRSFDEPFNHSQGEEYDEYRSSQGPDPALQRQPQVSVSISNYDSPSSPNAPMDEHIKTESLARDPLSLRYITVSPESGGPGNEEHKASAAPDNGGLSRTISPTPSQFDLHQYNQPTGPALVPPLGTWSTPSTELSAASPANSFQPCTTPSAGSPFYDHHQRHGYPTAARIGSPLSTASTPLPHVTHHDTAPRMDGMLPPNAANITTNPSPSPSMSVATMSPFLQPPAPSHHASANAQRIKPPKPVHKYGDMYEAPGSNYVDEGYFSPSYFGSKPEPYSGVVGLGVYSD